MFARLQGDVKDDDPLFYCNRPSLHRLQFKQLFDAKKKLNNSSLSEMYCKVKGEIDNLDKGAIGTSTLENFYKCRTNPKPNTLKLIASWVENKRRDHSEKTGEN